MLLAPMQRLGFRFDLLEYSRDPRLDRRAPAGRYGLQPVPRDTDSKSKRNKRGTARLGLYPARRVRASDWRVHRSSFPAGQPLMMIGSQ